MGYPSLLPGLWHREGTPNEIGQPRLGALAVLSLAAGVARDDANRASSLTRVPNRASARARSSSVSALDQDNVPHDLDARGGRVDVLADRARRSVSRGRRARARNDHRRCDPNRIAVGLAHAAVPAPAAVRCTRTAATRRPSMATTSSFATGKLHTVSHAGEPPQPREYVAAESGPAPLGNGDVVIGPDVDQGE